MVTISEPVQAVTGLVYNDSLRDTHQHKIFYDGSYFYMMYFDEDDLYLKYVSSADGITWGSPVEYAVFSVGPYYGSNISFSYPSSITAGGRQIVINFVGSNGSGMRLRYFSASGGVLTAIAGGMIGGGPYHVGGPCSNINGTDYNLGFVDYTPTRIRLQRYAITLTDEENPGFNHGTTTTGGVMILAYKSASPYDMIGLVKDSSDKLYWIDIALTGLTGELGTWTELATLATGFSTFAAVSEAQSEGASEIIHLIYLKSDDSLCYRKFESDAWGSEVELVASGATYPCIANRGSGKLWVFYVSGGEIYYKEHDGTSWQTVAKISTEHTFDTPVYLSCSRNKESGYTSLVWTETGSSYDIWFASLLEVLDTEVAKNKFPDNVSSATTSAAIETWLDGLSITTVHDLNMLHSGGFYRVTVVYV